MYGKNLPGFQFQFIGIFQILKIMVLRIKLPDQVCRFPVILPKELKEQQQRKREIF